MTPEGMSLPPHIAELQSQFPPDAWWMLKGVPPTPLNVSAYLDHEDGTLGVALTLRLTVEQAQSLLEKQPPVGEDPNA